MATVLNFMDWTNPQIKIQLEKRAKIIHAIREFFINNGFLELDTPLIVKHPGTEPNLNPLSVTVTDEQGNNHPAFLITSPEFSLKKILATGATKIFQLNKCFRNNEPWGGAHNPEFTLLEWYEVGKNYLELMETVERMICAVATMCHPERSEGSLNTDRRDSSASGLRMTQCGSGMTIDLTPPWTRMTMQEAWQKYVGADLNDFLTYDKISKLAQDKGYTVNVGESYDDLFFKIFLTEIEPKIANGPKPVFLYDYPAQMAALSRLKADDARYAERFELYFGGLELANAYGELTNADEQARRFEADVQKRAELGKPAITPDPELIQALKQGIPPVSGIAIGIDRLIMVLIGAKNIEDVIPLSIKNLFK